ARHLVNLDSHEIAWWELVYAVPAWVRRMVFGIALVFATLPMYSLQSGFPFGVVLAALSGLVCAVVLSKPTAPRPGRITFRRNAEPLRARLSRGLAITLFGGLVGLLSDQFGDGLVFDLNNAEVWDGLVFGLVG